MKKRMLSFLLALVMVFGLIPGAALAAEETTGTVTLLGTNVYSSAYEVFDLINAERTAGEKAGLTHNANLNAAAMQRAAELALYYSHSRPDGSSWGTVLDGLSGGHTNTTQRIAIGPATAQAAVEAWMANEGDKAQILDSKYTQVGVGCFYTGESYAWVLLFGDSTSDTTPVTQKADAAVQVSAKVKAANLNLSHTGSKNVDLKVDEVSGFTITNTNLENTAVKVTLLPQAADLKAEDGTLIAQVTLDESTGAVTVTRKSERGGSISFPVYAGQSDAYTLVLANIADQDACEHSYGKWQVVTYPDQNSRGEKQQTCAKCGKVVTADVMALEADHANGNPITVYVEGEGEGTYNLSIQKAEAGHEVFLEILPGEGSKLTGARYGADEDVEVEAPVMYGPYTCFVMPQGKLYIELTFELTDEETTTPTTEATDPTEPSEEPTQPSVPECKTHTFGNWKVADYPSGDYGGRKERTCTVCGATESANVMEPEDDHADGHAITVTVEGGQAEYNLSIQKAEAGHQVFLEVLPGEGYALANVRQGTDQGVDLESSTNYGNYICFTMPDGNLYITLVMEEAETADPTEPECDHSFGKWVVEQYPTDSYDGKKTRTCSKCQTVEVAGIMYKEDPHANGYPISVSIQGEGQVEYSLSIEKAEAGHQVFLEVIPAQGTTLKGVRQGTDQGVDLESSVDYGPYTCFTMPAGSLYITLVVEGTDVTPTDPECDHEFSHWAVTVYPDQNSDGEKTRTCAKCGLEETAGIMEPEEDHANGYPVTVYVEGDGEGTYNLSIQKAEAGHEVFLEILPGAGSKLTGARFGAKDGVEVDNPTMYGVYTCFVMPDGELFIELTFEIDPDATEPSEPAEPSDPTVPTEPEDACDHSYSTWSVTAYPDDADPDGEKTRTCAKCGKVQTAGVMEKEEDHPTGYPIQVQVVAEGGEVLSTLNYALSIDRAVAGHKVFMTIQAPNGAVLKQALYGADEGVDVAPPEIYGDYICFTMPAGVLYVKLVFEDMGNPFTDVDEDDYFYTPVMWAVSNGITSGVSETKFGSNQTCTRAQAMTFLWAACGKPEPTTTASPFTDVKETDYFFKAVLWAVENGITSGVSATQFGSNQPCTRAQVVTFLWAASGKPEPTTAENPFTDVTEKDYFYKAVLWAAENGITSGVSATRFGYNNPCTRAQIVTFLYKTVMGSAG